MRVVHTWLPFTVVAAFVLSGCPGRFPFVLDGGGDAAPSETGADTGPTDMGVPDTGPADTGTPDTGPVDTGVPDTGPVDAGGCTVAADCPTTTSECIVATCTAHVCGTMNLDATHTLTVGQTPGDCQRLVCNGAGGSQSVDDATDLPTSTNACLINPACTGTPLAPSFTPAVIGTACNSGGGSLCGAPGTPSAGMCVQCNLASDCVPSGNECVATTCTAGVCGTMNLDATHTLSTGQAAGDCQRIVCNGAGGVTSIDDPTDLPTSPSVCLANPACTGTPLAPSFTPVVAGTSCPSGVCGAATAAGTCVQCNTASDCPATGNVCVVPTCTANVCGTTNLGAATAPAALQTPGDCQRTVCNGAGGFTSVDDPTDLPTSNTECLINPACVGPSPLTPSFTPSPTGTACSESGGRVCGDTSNSLVAGTCVGCNTSADCPSGTCIAFACH